MSVITTVMGSSSPTERASPAIVALRMPVPPTFASTSLMATLGRVTVMVCPAAGEENVRLTDACSSLVR